MKPIIEIENLTLNFGDKRILDSVSLQIFKGDYLSIIGPNGAGKTSLLKCIMRIYTGYQGTILVKDVPTTNLGQKRLARSISYVPQANGRIFPFTVEEFVMLGRYPYLSPFASFTAQDRIAAKEALSLTGLQCYADRLMTTLSGGERQIAFIAAAVAQGAEIMLLDEPTTFLDPKHEAEIYSILNRLNRELGMTIVTVTHDINMAALQSQRIVILKQGQIVSTGDAKQIMRNEVLAPAFDKQFVFLAHPITGQPIIAPEVQP
ncbi:MAG: ABC transporter ATP-binding protein [candidate division KSB1 bacterium]|nr:ABC transporter ATP-binding protein [candidate division KSB1 bacterium]MDZ7358650.1 ABC transporter ATP-binding protein [candidate division KSB1 bacterium]